MTDSEAMVIANRLSEMNWKMCQLVHQLSQHKNGEAMIHNLRANGYDNPADAPDVIHDSLLRPEKWAKIDGRYRYSR